MTETRNAPLIVMRHISSSPVLVLTAAVSRLSPPKALICSHIAPLIFRMLNA